MNYSLIFILMLAFVMPVSSVESFAGINLDVDTREAAYSKLTEKGYNKVNMFGTTCFNKSIGGVNAYVVIPSSEDTTNTTSIISIIFMPDESSGYTTYNSLNTDYTTIKNIMTNKYGKSKSAVKFSRPYENGDGYELTALKTGKLLKADIWDTEGMTITMIASKSCIFKLMYVSNKSLEDHREKEAETAKDL